ncbi:hypothetical protein CsSME_00028749 [Camellia sinensis var. sinensis]
MGGNSPCASCKMLRRRCTKDCIFAPYFPSDDPRKFAIVHKVFGASNVSKMLQDLPVHQRADAVSSIVYEANARMRDPVYGCVGAISYLQNQVSQLQMQLAVAQAEIFCIQMQQELPMQTPNKHEHEHEHEHEYEHEHELELELELVDPDDKSYFLHDNLPHHHQYLDFASSSNVMQGSLKRESLFGHHDMISS